MLKIAIAIALLAAIAAFPARELRGTGPTSEYPAPEDGSVSRGAYRNEYLGFVYPLPPDWVEDVPGPPPSATGYYALAAFKPRDSLAATLLIAAQDNFFGSRPMASAADFLDQLKRQLVPSISAEPPLQTVIAGQPFAKLDYAGAGLHHVALATEIRCHTVIFSLTSASMEHIGHLLASFDKITFTAKTSRRPICVAQYATDDHIIHRVEPAAAGPRFSSMPARIVIGADGTVEHVHPIGGLLEQAQSVRDALSRWRFKPYLLNGNPVTIETGLIVQFTKNQ
jgi:hypothetical protein